MKKKKKKKRKEERKDTYNASKGKKRADLKIESRTGQIMLLSKSNNKIPLGGVSGRGEGQGRAVWW